MCGGAQASVDLATTALTKTELVLKVYGVLAEEIRCHMFPGFGAWRGRVE